MERWESPVDRAIREAQERGEFDNLPGAGKPLRGLGNPEADDPDWWVKGFVKREHLDLTGAMPPAMALRKEAETFPESLVELHTEQSVRVVLEDFNRRVKLDRLRPAVGPFPPLIARTVDVDDLIRQWHDLRARDLAGRQQAVHPPAEATSVYTAWSLRALIRSLRRRTSWPQTGSANWPRQTWRPR